MVVGRHGSTWGGAELEGSREGGKARHDGRGDGRSLGMSCWVTEEDDGGRLGLLGRVLRRAREKEGERGPCMGKEERRGFRGQC